MGVRLATGLVLMVCALRHGWPMPCSCTRLHVNSSATATAAMLRLQLWLCRPQAFHGHETRRIATGIGADPCRRASCIRVYARRRIVSAPLQRIHTCQALASSAFHITCADSSAGKGVQGWACYHIGISLDIIDHRHDHRRGHHPRIRHVWWLQQRCVRWRFRALTYVVFAFCSVAARGSQRMACTGTKGVHDARRRAVAPRTPLRGTDGLFVIREGRVSHLHRPIKAAQQLEEQTWAAKTGTVFGSFSTCHYLN